MATTPLTLAERRDALRRVAVFQHFTDEQCDAALSVMTPRLLRTGDVLYRAGEDGSTMVVVQEGRLRAEIEDGRGRRVEVGAIGPGEVVGEMALLDPAPRTADVIAACDTTVFELTREGAMQLRKAQPAAFSALVGEVITDVTKRLRSINQRVERELGGKPAKAETGSHAAIRPLDRGDASPHRADRASGLVAAVDVSGESFFRRFWSKWIRS